MLIIQQKPLSDLTMPWQVNVDSKGFVKSGRPDSVRLLGFQRGEEQHIVVWTEDVTAENVTEVIGLVPVFVAADGSGLFAAIPEVEHARVVAEP